MGYFKQILCCAFAVLGLPGVPALAGQLSNPGFQVPDASVNGGGAVGLHSENGADMFSRVDATIGQASPTGVSRNDAAPVLASGGFWTTVKTGMESPGCAGDCNGDGVVTINELIKGVNIALGSTPLDACARLDVNGDDGVTVDELIRAVSYALNDCPAH